MEKKLKKYLKNNKFLNVSEKTSKTMSAIKSKNNKSTEIKLKMALVGSKLKGWKLNYKDLPGKPDFYFTNHKLAIFVDGCFWHGCPQCGHIPKTRTSFWNAKISRNIERDKLINENYKNLKIKIIRIWEHEIKNKIDLQKIIAYISKLLIKGIKYDFNGSTKTKPNKSRRNR